MRRRLQAWFNRLPIEDPVDRRNAFFMQFLFVFVGVAIPANKLYVIVFGRIYSQLLMTPGGGFARWAVMLDLSTDVAMTVSAWCGLYLVRTGRFHRSVSQFLIVLLGSALVAYATFGYWTSFGDLLPVMAIALGGLMLGRRVLWTIYLAVMADFVVGMTSDLIRHTGPAMNAVKDSLLPNAYVDLPSRALSYLLVVVILDRSTAAWRESLRESDIDRRRLRKEMALREQAQEQLLHARKMDAVGKLASGVAHDFNNVLGIILGFARERHRLDEPDAQGGDDAVALASALKGVELAARRGASVSRKLLSFSRSDVSRQEVFDVGATLRELEPLLRQLMPPQARLHLAIADVPLPVCFDRSQFELALLNLVSNAVDALPEGGDIMVAAWLEDGRIRLTVHDDGIGMAPQVRQRIFDPFYTTKPSGSGTGLGLSVVHEMVERAGGSIVVDSEPGAGSTFRIDLPSMAHAGQAAADTSGSGIRVLLIDDDDDLRPLLASTLEAGGCVVSAAANGAEAEQYVRRAAQPPQVLVCDNHLSDTDGANLLRKLRIPLPRVPVILISAAPGSERQPASEAIEFTERLPKPFAPSHLLKRVLAAAGRSHREGQSNIST